MCVYMHMCVCVCVYIDLYLYLFIYAQHNKISTTQQKKATTQHTQYTLLIIINVKNSLTFLWENMMFFFWILWQKFKRTAFI